MSWGCWFVKNNEGVEFNEFEMESLVEEQGRGIEDNVWEVESNRIYIGRMFGDEEEPYEAYDAYALLKRLDYVKARPLS